MILEEQRRPPFDPLTPLLPEEVCWLLDRSFACEVNDPRCRYVVLYHSFHVNLVLLQMEWHAGKTLSQSVYTILFVHQLPDINPEYLGSEEEDDPQRPRCLTTVVVRAGILGLLKCCDFAWRELSKNRVHDVGHSVHVSHICNTHDETGRRLARRKMRCLPAGRNQPRPHLTYARGGM